MTILDELLAGSLADATRREAQCPLSALEAQFDALPTPVSAVAALSRDDRINIIAEVKRASPSRGSLSDIPDPSALALCYAENGAAAVSVLTEERRFKGSLDDLRRVTERVSVPVLRKEFIGTRYQIAEARVAGASMVLLIAACLSDAELCALAEYARELSLTVLFEAHDRDEVLRCVDAGANIVGVNARDLKTFELHPERFGSLADNIPSGVVRVAESAVKTPADVRRYVNDGAQAVLIGEALVTHDDPANTLKAFLNA